MEGVKKRRSSALVSWVSAARRTAGAGLRRSLGRSRGGDLAYGWHEAEGLEGLVRRGCGGWLAGENESGRIFGSGEDPEEGETRGVAAAE